MDISAIPRLTPAPATPGAALLAALTERQFLRPHQRLRPALIDLAAARQLPLRAVDESLRILQIDSQIALGRLRHTDLSQLAASMDRLRRQVRIRPCAV